MTEPVDPTARYIERMRLVSQREYGTEFRPGLAHTLASSDASSADLARIGALVRSLDTQKRLRLLGASGAIENTTREDDDLLDAAGAGAERVKVAKYEQAMSADTDLPWWQDVTSWVSKNLYGVDVNDPDLTDEALTRSLTAPGGYLLGETLEAVGKAMGWLYRTQDQANSVLRGNPLPSVERLTEMQAQGYDPADVWDNLAFNYSQGESTFRDLSGARERFGSDDVDLALEIYRTGWRSEDTLFNFRNLIQQQMVNGEISPEEAAEKIRRSEDPEFINGAYEALDRQHVSLGRDLARALLPDSWTDDPVFTAVSGTGDALYAVFADPTILGVEVYRTAQMVKWGLDSTDSATIYHKLGLADPVSGRPAPAVYREKYNNRAAGIEDFLRRAGEFRDAVKVRDYDEAAAIYRSARVAHPQMISVWSEINGLRPAVTAAEREAAAIAGPLRFRDGLGLDAPHGGVRWAPIETLEQFADWASNSWGLMRMANGLPARERMLMPGRMGVIAQKRAARAMLTYRNKATAARAGGATLIDFTDDALDDVIGSPADDIMQQVAKERGDQLFDDSTARNLATRIRARATAAKRRITTFMPHSREIALHSGADAKVVEQWARIYLPNFEAARFAAMWESGTEGSRRTLLRALVLETFEAAGLTRSAAGREYVDKWITDNLSLGLNRRRYGFGGSDVIQEGYSGTRRSGLYPSQAQTMVSLPSFPEMRQIAAKAAVMGYDPHLAWFGLNTKSAQRLVMGAGKRFPRMGMTALRYWLFNSTGIDKAFGLVKMGWILTGANMTRNLLDEYGNLLLTSQRHRLVRGRQTARDAGLNNKYGTTHGRIAAGWLALVNARIPRELRMGIRDMSDAMRVFHTGKIRSMGREASEQRIAFANELNDEIIHAELGDALGARMVDDAADGMGHEYAQEAARRGVPVERIEYKGHELVDRDGGFGLVALSNNYGQRFLTPRMLPIVKREYQDEILEWATAAWEREVAEYAAKPTRFDRLMDSALQRTWDESGRQTREVRVVNREGVLHAQVHDLGAGGSSSEAPVEYVYRVVSKPDYERMKREGVANTNGQNSHGRYDDPEGQNRPQMFGAIVPSQITKIWGADLSDPDTVLLKIKYHPEDGWYKEMSDGNSSFVATRQELPFDRVEDAAPFRAAYDEEAETTSVHGVRETPKSLQRPPQRVSVDMARRWHEATSGDSPFVFRNAEDSPANAFLAYIMWRKAIDDPEFFEALDDDTRWLMSEMFPNARMRGDVENATKTVEEFKATELRLLHGTAREFDRFDPSPEFSNSRFRVNEGVYMTDKPEVAQTFAYESGQVEYFPSTFYRDFIEERLEYAGVTPELREALEQAKEAADSLRAQVGQPIVSRAPASGVGAPAGDPIRAQSGSVVVIEDRTSGEVRYRIGTALNVQRGMVTSVKYGEMPRVEVDNNTIRVMVVGDQDSIDVAGLFGRANDGDGMPTLRPFYPSMAEVREVLARYRTGEGEPIIGAMSGKARGTKPKSAPAIVPQASLQPLPEQPTTAWTAEPRPRDYFGSEEKAEWFRSLADRAGKLKPVSEAPAGRRAFLRMIETELGLKIDWEDYLLKKAIDDTGRGSNGRFQEELSSWVHRQLRDKYHAQHIDRVSPGDLNPGDFVWTTLQADNTIVADAVHPYAPGADSGSLLRYSDNWVRWKIRSVGTSEHAYTLVFDDAFGREVRVPKTAQVNRVRSEAPARQETPDAPPSSETVVTPDMVKEAEREVARREADILRAYLAARIRGGAKVRVFVDGSMQIDGKTKFLKVDRLVSTPEELAAVDSWPEIQQWIDGYGTLFTDPETFQIVKKGFTPRVIEANTYGRTLDLRDEKNIPDDLRAALEAEGVFRPWMRDLPNADHDRSKALIDYMRANGYGRVRVRDMMESGFDSYIVLPEMIAYGRDPVDEFTKSLAQAVASNPPKPEDLANILRDKRYDQMRRDLEIYNVDEAGNRIPQDDAKGLDAAIVRNVPRYIEDLTAAVSGPEGQINPELAGMLLRGEVPDAYELRKYADDLPPMAIKAQYGPAGDSPVAGIMDGFTARARRWYDGLVTKPIRTILRQPLYTDMYTTARFRTQEMADNLVNVHAWDREVADEWARGVARRQALIEVVKYIDNPRVASQFSHMSRNWWSFFRAQEDWLRRYGRALKADPAAIRKAHLAIIGAEEAGIIDRDADGNLLITYPGTGAAIEAYLRIANYVGWVDDSALLADVPDLTTRLTFMSPSLNNPFAYSATPMVSLPMRFVTALMPGGDMIDAHLDRMVNGELGAGRAAWEQVLPPPILRLLQLADDDHNTGSKVGSAMATAMQFMALNGTLEQYGDTSTERARFLQDLETTATNILAARQVFAFFAPGAPGMPHIGEEGEDAMSSIAYQDAGIRTLKDEFNHMVATMGFGPAIVLWSELYPDKPVFEYGKSQTSAPGANAPITIDAATYVANNRDFFTGEYASVAPYFLPENPGEFSQIAWETMLRTEVRQYKELDEFFIDLVTANGVTEYYSKQDAHEESVRLARMAGDDRLVAELRDEWDREKARLHVRFPTLDDWMDQGTIRSRERQDRLEVLERLVADPQAPGQVQPQLSGITEMLRVYHGYMAANESLGGSSSNRAVTDRQNLRSDYHTRMLEIISDYPSLRDVYNGIFRLMVEQE